MKGILNTDGGSRGNPGPGAIGIVLKNSENESIKELAKYIGDCTNNEAEYMALIEGIMQAINSNYDELDCFLDSELVVKQLNGQYKVKNERIKTFWQKVKGMENKFKRITFTHIPREKNSRADALVNEALDNEVI